MSKYILPCKGEDCPISYKCKNYHRYLKGDFTPQTWLIKEAYNKDAKTCINFNEATGSIIDETIKQKLIDCIKY